MALLSQSIENKLQRKFENMKFSDRHKELSSDSQTQAVDELSLDKMDQKIIYLDHQLEILLRPPCKIEGEGATY